MPPADPPPPGSEPADRSLRWSLIRDLTVFVAKASLEALRDLALIPAALVAGVAGLLLSPSRPDRYFQEILELGDRFDDFVDLFGREARRQREPGQLGRPSDDEIRADDVFDRVENLLVDEFNRGGVTAQAKEAIDRGLDALQEVFSDSAASEARVNPPRRRPDTAVPDRAGKPDEAGEPDGQ